jgi:hypothetical protein
VKNTCIACTDNADCNDGGIGPRLCNTAIPRCAASCGDQDADVCLSISSIPEACAVNQGFPYCVECTLIQPGVSSECMGRTGGRYCWGLPSGACGCSDDSDCPDGGECQGPSGPQGTLRFCAGWSPLN